VEVEEPIWTWLEYVARSGVVPSQPAGPESWRESCLIDAVFISNADT
jgi:hypothetical protein